MQVFKEQYRYSNYRIRKLHRIRIRIRIRVFFIRRKTNKNTFFCVILFLKILFVRSYLFDEY